MPRLIINIKESEAGVLVGIFQTIDTITVSFFGNLAREGVEVFKSVFNPV